MPKKIRIDKWLWAVRIYKTRTKASKACDEGKIKIDDSKVKSSYKVAVNDVIQVRINYQNRVYKVLDVIEKRVGAPLAEACYNNLTPPEEMEKASMKSAFHLPTAYRKRGEGRPTKRDRREIDSFRDDFLEDKDLNTEHEG